MLFLFYFLRVACICDRELQDERGSYINFRKDGLTAKLYPVDCRSQPVYQKNTQTQVKIANCSDYNTTTLQKQQHDKAVVVQVHQQEHKNQRQNKIENSGNPFNFYPTENQTNTQNNTYLTTKNHQPTKSCYYYQDTTTTAAATNTTFSSSSIVNNKNNNYGYSARKNSIESDFDRNNNRPRRWRKGKSITRMF